MIEQLPLSISILFVVITLITIFWFYRACYSKTYLWIIIAWTALQSIMGLTGVYQHSASILPRLMLFGAIPALLVCIGLLVTKSGRSFLDGFSLQTLTALHTIRILVEMVLIMLFYHGFVSKYMTFEGTNLDLFSGITAPFMAWYAFQEDNIKYRRLMTWNVVCLALLLNVVITAVIAIPSPFQKLSFDQPNIAIFYFPFNLLPTVVVPLVLLAHIAGMRLIYKALKERKIAGKS